MAKSVFVVFCVLLVATCYAQDPSDESRRGCPQSYDPMLSALWGSQCQGWAQCSNTDQSPVDLTTPANRPPGNFLPLPIQYKPDLNVILFNNGKSIKLPVDKREGNTLVFMNSAYYLKEVRWVSPSEHRIDGKTFDLEMQLVHAYDDHMGQTQHYSIVSVMFNLGATNPALHDVFFTLPEFSHCRCGNGRVEPGEQCDNGARNGDGPDQCKRNCVLPSCGDGIKDACEECDNGANNSNIISGACRENCMLPACGDGVTDDANEECDDANVQNRDGCDSQCRWECGNGNTDSIDFYVVNLTTGIEFEDVLEECDTGADVDLPPYAIPDGCRARWELLAPSSQNPHAGYVDINPRIRRCFLALCGDGVVDVLANESCDDGLSIIVPSSCRPDCSLPQCGDGVRDSAAPYNEECDLGANNNDVNSVCFSNCTSRCGDGVVQTFPAAAAEECDEGIDNSDSPNALCRSNCRLPYCGDGIVDTLGNATRDFLVNNRSYVDDGSIFDEECDGESWCGSDCRRQCGNGRIEGTENCDISINYNAMGVYLCSADCVAPRCGDGIINQLVERCDDGANNSYDPNSFCRPGCLTTRFCGDGILDDLYGEQCDDGNHDAEDGCDPNCKFECGNNKIGIQAAEEVDGHAFSFSTDLAEECDCGSENANTPNSCRAFSDYSNGKQIRRCTLPRCGDGIVDWGEECDDGSNNNNEGRSTCRSNCKLPFCGDGVTDLNEQCDNGKSNNDGPFDWTGSVPEESCARDCVWNYCRVSETTAMHNHTLDLNALLPKSKVALTYVGSLTEPPCTEAVQWIVFEDVQTISPLQLSQFRSLEGVEGKGRPIQDTLGNDCNEQRCSRFANNRLAPVCGDGIVEGAEECDEGSYNNRYMPNSCRPGCFLPKCGDHVVDSPHEECDDGNQASGDGCSFECKVEAVTHGGEMRGFWSYKRADSWGLTERFAGFSQPHKCNSGNQSPINLVRDTERDIGPVNTAVLDDTMHYNANINIEAYNTGKNTIFKVGTGAANQFHWDGRSYNLESIEIHMPSEHHINGDHADFEIQYIHRSGSNVVALAVLYDTVEMRNKYLEQFWFFIPRFTKYTCGNGRVEEGEECDEGMHNSDYAPDQCRTLCKLPKCGDGVVDMSEQCDWGAWNSNNVDGACRSDCRFARCGDGITDASHGEECDGGIHCTAKCTKLCGNRIVDAGEECDNGFANNDWYPSTGAVPVCRTSCLSAYCGDGVIDEGEQCDMGASNANVSNHCRQPDAGFFGGCIWPTCGDGITDPIFGEECDNGGDMLADRDSTCTPTCQSRCGNGLPDDGPDTCDDGAQNSNEPNHCRPNCHPPRCGDGVVDDSLSETCDDGAEGNSDNCTVANGCPRCSTLCQTRCGNGVIDPEEECDQGSDNSNNAPGCCRTNCKNAYCGDGVRDADEDCDDGTFNGAVTSFCTSGCVFRHCGDFNVDNKFNSPLLEECDGGPGCSPTCKLLCGNGMKDGNEECDNGPYNSDWTSDACRSNCVLPRCGDGVLDQGEACDHGEWNGNSSGAWCRPDCTLPFCGDGIIDPSFGEECDNGYASNSDTAKDGCSTDCHSNTPRQCEVDPLVSQINLNTPGAFPVLGEGSGVFHYEGSATRPPCAGQWSWFVFEQIQPIHPLQTDSYLKAFSSPNARGLQPLNGRRVWYPTTGPRCGNCKVEPGEECDDGERRSDSRPGACRSDCKKAHCGDGVVDFMMGEQCDGNPGCDEYCKWVRSCPLSANGGGSCPYQKGMSQSCPTGGCGAQQQVPANSTIINVNFAGILSKSTCSTCNN